MSEIFKNYMKFEYNEDEIKENSKNKKNSRFRIQLNFPKIEENKFVEINQDNTKNNFLSYTEIIMDDYLLKIEYHNKKIIFIINFKIVKIKTSFNSCV